MKKVLVIALVLLLSISTVFAASYKGASEKNSFSIGLNLGTNSGVVVNYGMGKFDIEGIVGFGLFNKSLDAEVAFNYAILDIAKSCKFDGYMPLTVGGEAYLSTDFNFFGVGGLVPVKIAYTFPKFPMTLYFRVAPGVFFDLTPNQDVKFGIHASLGATYNF